MGKKLLMGNEAIALGALRAGVSVVTGYPGTPSSEILETVAKQNADGVYVEWSVNEKAALEIAAGAAYSGARAMVTMKQVGLNVASDPLMSLNYVGIKGGMVIVSADDPGPISSQTEQDTRQFGAFAKVAVFDPSNPQEAYTMIADAFDCSEKYGRPVLFRPTTRVCHGTASVEILPPLAKRSPQGFTKDGGKWVIFPALAYANHKKIESSLKEMSREFSAYAANSLTGDGKKGIVSGGVSFAYTCEALDDLAACRGIPEPYKLFKVSAYPFPEQKALEFLKGLDEILVTEELDPVIESCLLRLIGAHNLQVKVKGKLDGTMRNAGENTVAEIQEVLSGFFNVDVPAKKTLSPSPILPGRPPVLCAGCPHRASFFAVKEAVKESAAKRKAVYSGDIGCYTLGNAAPLDMVDTCLCMGAGITVAQGINRVEPDTLNFAFIGDSTFFHSGITGIINAVYNKSNIIIVILDNYTTAMTGGQPHPGTGKTASRKDTVKADIHGIVTSLGVSELIRADAFDLNAAKDAVKRVIDKKGVRVLLFEGACVSGISKSALLSVDAGLCTGCKLCIKKTGCPALAYNAKKVVIDAELCTGCGLCASVCPAGAMLAVKR
ncbi:MAG: indolepyruvate ferredoxin oxidoreductase subunit alpha [Clostridiales bacterium]|nr:indolepyruvate ferredoxin oxidoreductase subunit alpha [Clostridiales bacterium]